MILDDYYILDKLISDVPPHIKLAMDKTSLHFKKTIQKKKY
jgi:hypothetical protein